MALSTGHLGINMNSLILRTATRLLIPLLVLFSIFLLLRGHNEPGGGFVGGLVASAGFALHGFAFHEQLTREALFLDTRLFIGVGLLIAVGSAIFPMFFGLPFMTGLWNELLIGGLKIDLGTPVFFDIGVYLAVIGVSLTILLALAEE